MGNTYQMTIQLHDDNDLPTDFIGVEVNNADQTLMEKVNEGFTVEDAHYYNQKVISNYGAELKHTESTLAKDFINVFQFNKTLPEWSLIKRQLTQCVAAIGLKLMEPIKGGYCINNQDNLIKEAHNKSILGFVNLSNVTNAHILVVDQQIDKLTPILSKDTFFDWHTFDAVLIFELHKVFNGELFENTIPQFYMALNDPSNTDYKINFIASSKNMIYYFIGQLGTVLNRTNFAKDMCIKQEINENTFSVSKNKAKSGSKNEISFAKRFDKVLDNRTKMK